jgi:Cof subfamily protein (haloacid dehalogenase superfamily)
VASNAAPRVRLLALDMDGTLFRQNLVISAGVQDAIRRAQTAGVKVALATGRMPAAARSFVDLLGLTGPQLYANGALVQTVEGEVIFYLPVDPPVARQVVDYARARSFHVNVYVGDSVYVDRLTPEAEFTRMLNRLDPVPVGDLASFVADHAPTKMVIVRLPAVEAGLLDQLRHDFQGRLLVFSSVPQYIEMVNPQVDKGRALGKLATILELSTAEIAAVGDGDNDFTLLQAAGLPIAMGNGTDRLKSIARYVVGTVEQDGVAEAIDRYVLPTNFGS